MPEPEVNPNPPAEETTPAGPQPGTPEHDAAMQEKFNKSQEGGVGDKEPGAISDPEKPQKPDYIPDKFWDSEKNEVRMEDVFKSYSELESKMGKEPPAGDDDDTSKGNKPDGTPVTEKLTNEEVQAFNKEYLENDGKLSDETYEKLEKKGYPRGYVDAYIQGQEALARESQATLYSEAGGSDGYARMIEWAGNNLSDADIDAFDSAVMSGNMNVAQMAVRSLAAQYRKAVGSDGDTITGGSGGGGNEPGGFQSKHEMQAAMNDPRYGKDKAYTESVIRRVDKMKW